MEHGDLPGYFRTQKGQSTKTMFGFFSLIKDHDASLTHKLHIPSLPLLLLESSLLRVSSIIVFSSAIVSLYRRLFYIYMSPTIAYGIVVPDLCGYAIAPVYLLLYTSLVVEQQVYESALLQPDGVYRIRLETLGIPQ
ncbi:hypothetical protein BDB01DRAFT_839245 [Pilobolus umbonatus]|nr:hypothetical protein BDB01DRAFT_839245 [Pilobolus umbonatus]